ncbi:uncharacterized protein BCR38DRAFT_485223 [Pseudomassariella vexata]|uniref:DUF7598 domain-containing protein n=1 Tax=Pseudomassariella vexata TaxID=1141098 RepID=A0A1Y2DYA1_9PEZI|nr:uncharacterized protein BCR38DRAFT_485223 [Pseudomassariella vexata]ORY64086.1 hypothetical protein BCR38DRAFT_485223 [Pseudomassariella vexata]
MFGKKPANSGRLQGLGYIILNIIRVINVLILSIIGAASVVLMVVAKLPNGFTFFNDIALFFVVGVCVVLVLAETEFERIHRFLDQTFPVIGPNRGLTWLGLAMIIMGSHTLGQLSDSRNIPQKMGLPFWRLCIAAGILAIVFGFLNIITSWLYSNKGSGLCAREVRRGGATVENVNWKDHSSQRSNSVRKEKSKSKFFGVFGGGRDKDTKKPQISGPINTSAYDHDLEAGCSDDESAYHPEVKTSPIVPNLVRPESSHHPYNRGNYIPRYSEASHIPRF